MDEKNSNQIMTSEQAKLLYAIGNMLEQLDTSYVLCIDLESEEKIQKSEIGSAIYVRGMASRLMRCINLAQIEILKTLISKEANGETLQ